LADIAVVGRCVDQETQQDKYAIFLGGDRLGRRLNKLYKDLVPADQLVAALRPLLFDFRHQRLPGETLGDFFVRTST
jgi:sulfite reductase beta subunit-like hemoprotein